MTCKTANTLQYLRKKIKRGNFALNYVNLHQITQVIFRKFTSNYVILPKILTDSHQCIIYIKKIEQNTKFIFINKKNQQLALEYLY